LSQFTRARFASNVHHSPLQNTIAELVNINRRESWDAVAKRLERKSDDGGWELSYWLSPGHGFGEERIAGALSLFDANDVLGWVQHKPRERAPLIARVCPKTLSANEYGGLSRELLVRYGDRDEVRGALWSNFGCEGWCGNASDHHRAKRDKMRGWLSAESSPRVIEWLKEYIGYLGRRISHAEIDEERSF
jgi:hypothetical protein